jgi:2,3-bisphosphoglycerate-dependent phosphoglycerate mutase
MTIFLIRHAEPISADTPGIEDNDRQLTSEGERAAELLAQCFDAIRIDAVYSSPYSRAVETVKPIAQRHNLPVTIEADLRERSLTTRDLEWDEFLDCQKRSWIDIDYRLEGGESRREVVDRGLRVLNLISSRYPSGNSVVGSHAGLITSVLTSMDPSINEEFGLAMSMPAVYRIQHVSGHWRLVGAGAVD